jgi:hypothetical protein
MVSLEGVPCVRISPECNLGQLEYTFVVSTQPTELNHAQPAGANGVVAVVPVRQPLCSLAGRYDSPMQESGYIHNKGLRIWLLDMFMGANVF